MPELNHGHVLTVGLPCISDDESPGVMYAPGGAAAIELLRMLRFDLVVTADQLPDMPVWQFVKRMRNAWPWQKWALVSSQLSEQNEIVARTLGVMQIIEGSLDLEAVGHLANSIRVQVEASQRLVSRSATHVLRPAASAG